MPGQFQDETQKLQLLVWEPPLGLLAVAGHVPVGCLPPQYNAAAEGKWRPAGPQAGVVREPNISKGADAVAILCQASSKTSPSGDCQREEQCLPHSQTAQESKSHLQNCWTPLPHSRHVPAEGFASYLLYSQDIHLQRTWLTCKCSSKHDPNSDVVSVMNTRMTRSLNMRLLNLMVIKSHTPMQLQECNLQMMALQCGSAALDRLKGKTGQRCSC